jgi:protein FRA10AC1
MCDGIAHRFIRDDDIDAEDESYEARLARKYYNRLFKEYCLADLSVYKTGRIGLRWRTEKEVINGKGHFTCGNLKCNATDALASYEVSGTRIVCIESPPTWSNCVCVCVCVYALIR